MPRTRLLPPCAFADGPDDRSLRDLASRLATRQAVARANRRRTSFRHHRSPWSTLGGARRRDVDVVSHVRELHAAVTAQGTTECGVAAPQRVWVWNSRRRLARLRAAGGRNRS